jgi:hypothetical protein
MGGTRMPRGARSRFLAIIHRTAIVSFSGQTREIEPDVGSFGALEQFHQHSDIICTDETPSSERSCDLVIVTVRGNDPVLDAQLPALGSSQHCQRIDRSARPFGKEAAGVDRLFARRLVHGNPRGFRCVDGKIRTAAGATSRNSLSQHCGIVPARAVLVVRRETSEVRRANSKRAMRPLRLRPPRNTAPVSRMRDGVGTGVSAVAPRPPYIASPGEIAPVGWVYSPTIFSCTSETVGGYSPYKIATRRTL